MQSLVRVLSKILDKFQIVTRQSEFNHGRSQMRESRLAVTEIGPRISERFPRPQSRSEVNFQSVAEAAEISNGLLHTLDKQRNGEDSTRMPGQFSRSGALIN
jgi:hypothetical protein